MATFTSPDEEPDAYTVKRAADWMGARMRAARTGKMMDNGKTFLMAIGCMVILSLAWIGIIVAVAIFAILRFS